MRHGGWEPGALVPGRGVGELGQLNFYATRLSLIAIGRYEQNDNWLKNETQYGMC